MQQEELFVAGATGPIHLVRFGGRNRTQEPVLVVPNGYGLLAYGRTLCLQLAERVSPVYGVNLRGQGPSGGRLSVDGCSEDLAEVVSLLSGEHRRVTLIVHCSAMLYLLNWGRDSVAWNGVRQVILYSYLSTPRLHVPRFIRKAKRFGIRVSSELGFYDYTAADYRALPAPLHVVHPLCGMNLVRASLRDIDSLSGKAHPASVVTPPAGYEIDDEPQIEEVQGVLQNYFLPLITRPDPGERPKGGAS